MAIINGTNGGEILVGGEASDLINARAGTDVLEGRGGNDVLHGDTNNDSLFGGEGNDVLDGGPDAAADGSFGSDTDKLDGGNGIDTADYSGVQHGMTVNLFQGISLGQGNVDTLVSIENITGTNFNDILTGDDGANLIQGADGNDVLNGGGGDDFLSAGIGNDLLKGDTGKDLLIGSRGADKLTGGSGADTFRFFSTNDGGVGAANRDVINDFKHTVDKIDLHFVDANIGATGNQDFAFIGGNNFSAAGQVRVVSEGDHTVVQINTAGTGVAEMEIQIAGHPTVSAADFIL